MLRHRRSHVERVPYVSATGRWFAVETKPNSERKALTRLKEQEFIVAGESKPVAIPFFLPAYLKTVSHARRIRTIEAPYWPRYLFAFFDDQLVWTPIKGTPGVLRLVCSAAKRPIPVPAGIIERLQARSAQNGGTIKLDDKEAVARYRKGQRVRINDDGPFTGHEGKIDEVPNEDRGIDQYQVLLEIFGRLTAIGFDETQLAAAS